jgi:hypothetical protein
MDSDTKNSVDVYFPEYEGWSDFIRCVTIESNRQMTVVLDVFREDRSIPQYKKLIGGQIGVLTAVVRVNLARSGLEPSETSYQYCITKNILSVTKLPVAHEDYTITLKLSRVKVKPGEPSGSEDKCTSAPLALLGQDTDDSSCQPNTGQSEANSPTAPSLPPNAVLRTSRQSYCVYDLRVLCNLVDCELPAPASFSDVKLGEIALLPISDGDDLDARPVDSDGVVVVEKVGPDQAKIVKTDGRTDTVSVHHLSSVFLVL